MKKRSIPLLPALSAGSRTLALCLCLLTGLYGFTACGKKQEQTPTETEPPTEVTDVPTEPAETTDPTEALRTYYEGLIQELRDELLEEREDRYISDHEYQQRLDELEAALEALEAETPADTPTGGEPETQPETQPEETAPPVSTAPFDYRLESGHIIITAYKGTDATVVIPPELEGYPVTAIDDHAFQNTAVTSVILPSTVTSVGWFAFYGCFGLEIVTVPASVTSIEYAAFDGCPNLTILCPAESYAARYAVSFGLKHEYI